MTLSFNSAEKTIIILNDLIKINNDRIACYERAIGNEKNLDTDLKQIFSDVIAEANNNKQQLIDKVKSLSRNPKDASTLSGILHRAWTDLKVTLIGESRKAIINSCLYNEEIAQHTYEAALNVSGKMSEDVHTIIQQQHAGIKETYNHIKSYREVASYYGASRLAYAN
ncbi:aldehyde dehydrogenase [Flavipsychrobacter stenotrophus]|uniref:Aldehyde dehydrogenase n=1 Tax=Flavipsychrobacter stenotrophus TaxID=2077091 RepID=A0A2S7SQG3_9BACT|nr:PA2169 family four-helix-bundle protein [Flavipsychrobacter stenotrophus]PQJ09143.1 aldehyde dehydrogenase [Flavipsychrobacter stenotrophus]